MGLKKGDWVKVVRNCSRKYFDKYIGEVRKILSVKKGDEYPYQLLLPQEESFESGWKEIELKKVKPLRATPKYIIMWDEAEKDPYVFVYTDAERDCIINELFTMDNVYKSSIQIWGLSGKFKIKHEVVEDKED